MLTAAPPPDGWDTGALSERKGISFVTVHHHHPPQVCPRVSSPTLIVPENPPPTRGKKTPHRFPGFLFQMCRRCQRGQVEMKGETREN